MVSLHDGQISCHHLPKSLAKDGTTRFNKGMEGAVCPPALQSSENWI